MSNLPLLRPLRYRLRVVFWLAISSSMGTFPVLISTLVRVRVPTGTNLRGNQRQRDNLQNGSDVTDSRWTSPAQAGTRQSWIALDGLPDRVRQ